MSNERDAIWVSDARHSIDEMWEMREKRAAATITIEPGITAACVGKFLIQRRSKDGIEQVAVNFAVDLPGPVAPQITTRTYHLTKLVVDRIEPHPEKGKLGAPEFRILGLL